MQLICVKVNIFCNVPAIFQLNKSQLNWFCRKTKEGTNGKTYLLLTLGIGALDRWVCRNLMRCVRCGFMGLVEPLVALT
jgi:hypothetical protein